jgi:hypothetical protein
LGTGEEYLQAVANLKYGAIEATRYYDTAVQPDVYEPDNMHALVWTCLREPDSYLYQGFGRLQLASIRRMRVRALYSDEQGYQKSPNPNQEFNDLLVKDSLLIQRLCDLLEEYYSDDTNAWRLLWLLFLSKSLLPDDITDKPLSARFVSILKRIQDSARLSVVPRLWAKTMPNFLSATAWNARIEDLHALSYVERGQQCYGA